MKKQAKTVLTSILSLLLCGALFFGGCAATDTSSTQDQTYVVSIEQTSSDGTQDVYTVTYSDGTTTTFTVTNGKDGEDGQDGQDGQDGTSLSLSELYEQYKEATGEDLTLSEFLSEFLSFSDDSATRAVQKNLLSVLKIYAEFIVSESYSMRPGQIQTVSDTALCTGSTVIYDMDTAEDGYTYIVTNYHVVYLEEANATYNGGSKIARKICGYLYGSEDTPSAAVDESTNTAQKDEIGYTVYDYGEAAIALEYVGGSVSADIAVLRAKTSDILAISPSATAVTLADSYRVGETAIAIGNPESLGISVTEGIVSVENDYITLSIDGTERSYRSIRIDTALYSGNSGGGLFNVKGELIGITNAGDSADENINYAVPLEIVRGTADSIIFYFEQGDTAQCAYKLTFGITVSTQNSSYVYDVQTGYGTIEEEVVVQSVTADSVAEACGLQAGDLLCAILVNGERHEITRSFHISDLALTLREGDVIQLLVSRDGEEVLSGPCTLQASDLTAVA